MNRDMIDLYAAGAEKLSLGIRGLTAEDLKCLPSDPKVGKWSIQQLVVHLADAEQVTADRMKRVIAEDNPPLVAFDENKWTANLHYDGQSAEDAAKLVELTRKQMAIVLRELPDNAFTRSGMHSESGKKTLASLVEGAVKHLEHHLNYLHAKRAAMGKEMW